MYAFTDISITGNSEWNRYESVLFPMLSDDDADLKITFNGQACIVIGCVSLMNHDNFHGMRRDVIENMKNMGISVLRWPGGNFAGDYNWFDGLLPIDERAPFASNMTVETQPQSRGYDFHEINTDDFIALCREINAEPFLTINITWNTPKENAAWVEYCNGDIDTKYGRIRAERGHPDPYNVMLWSLGNEAGFGHMEGDNSASGYSHLAKANAKKMLEVSSNLLLCSSGPYPNSEWVNYSAKPLSSVAPMVSLHMYGHHPQYWDFSKLNEEYKRCIKGVWFSGRLIEELRNSLQNNQKISFDEWNIWKAWERQSCIIDGMYTVLMMHMFIEKSNKNGVDMACHFEAVNESAIKVTPNGSYLTATGKMLKLMKEHSGARILHADYFSVVTEKNDEKTVTLINSSCDEKKKFSVKADGECVESRLYYGKDLFPCSDFVETELATTAMDGFVNVELPPLSVGILKIEAK